MTHHSLAITEISFDVINAKQSIHIIPANILETENGALQAGVRRELQKMMANNEHIDAVEPNKKFYKSFQKLSKRYLEITRRRNKHCIELSFTVCPSTPPDCYNCAIIASIIRIFQSDGPSKITKENHNAFHLILISKTEVELVG